MAKIAAYGTTLNMGIQQVVSTPVVGTITGSGNATFTMTKSGMTGSPLAISVAVLNGDTTDTTATKAVAAMNATPNFAAKCVASCSGSTVYVTALAAAANDGTMNLAYTNGTCTGLTPDATSDNPIAGVAMTAVVYVSKISGPKLNMDTQDVTTHDQATAWEEMVASILHSGELGLDIIYDPNAVTHAATSGLLAKLQARTFAQYAVVFPGPYTWTFNGFSTGFEPDAPVDGGLSAKVTLKLTGVPTLV